MALWKYQDANGNWNEAAGREVIALAGSGGITPETLIESPDGKRTVAEKVKGLTFVSKAMSMAANLEEEDFERLQEQETIQIQESENFTLTPVISSQASIHLLCRRLK